MLPPTVTAWHNSSAVESFGHEEPSMVLTIKSAEHRGGGTKTNEGVPLAPVAASALPRARGDSVYQVAAWRWPGDTD
jgi:hypothetical protein